MASEMVSIRLLRDDPAPPSPDGTACRLGLQDDKEQLHGGRQGADGKLAFDFTLKVKQGPDPDRPIFTGPFAHGPRNERFVYLSWQRTDGPGYVNRIKIRLTDIDWPLVRAAQTSGRSLITDASGRAAGGGRVPVAWRIAEE